MADDTPQTPSGIRPITIKPIAPKPAASAAAPAAPAAPAPAAAGAAPQPTIRLKPIVPRPFVAPGAKPAAPAAPAAAAAPAPAPAAPAPAPAPAAPAAAPAPTIRLKPVSPALRPASVTANLKAPEAPAAAPAEDLSATIQISAPPPVAATAAPGGIKPAAPVTPRPLAPSPASAEMKSEQLQAAKSKTSRISLDAALTAGESAGGPRTIRIKRPGTEAPVGKLTSHIPAQPAAGEGGDTPLSQRRTIRVKRPASGPAAAPAPAADAGAADASSGETVTPPDFVTDVPPSAFSFSEAPVEKTSPVFPILGLLAVAALGVAIFYLLMGDAAVFNGALWPTPR